VQQDIIAIQEGLPRHPQSLATGRGE
jgi:hypothetical protein